MKTSTEIQNGIIKYLKSKEAMPVWEFLGFQSKQDFRDAHYQALKIERLKQKYAFLMYI